MPMKFTRNSIPTTSEARSARSQAGFTLFEILAVLALASIVFLVVASGRYDFGVNAKTELEAERVRMIARIAHARNEAITAGEERGITLAGTTLTYDGDLVPMTGEAKTVQLKGVRADWAQIRLDAYGWRPEWGPNTLKLTHIASDRSVTISIGEGGYAE